MAGQVTQAPARPEAPKTKRVLTAVRTAYNVQFFGINTTQISATMSCLHLEWTGEHVKVTHDGFPGEEKWILPGGICEMTWKEKEVL